MQDTAGTATGQNLNGKTALITGAARRIGAEVVRTLHAEGANVVLTYRGSARDAEALRDELTSQRPDSALALHANLLETAELPGLVSAAMDRFGSLDILVNNASSFYPTPLGEIDEEKWEDLIGTNLKAPLFLAQAAAPALRAARGALINMVDIHARNPLGKHLVYCAAKAGLAMLTLSLARELGPEVRVNGIAPGPVLWPEAGLDEELQKKVVSRTALKRAGSPADIASLIVYLVRDAGYITGQIIAVDGGRSVGW